MADDCGYGWLMACWFVAVDRGFPDWLSDHPDEFVLDVGDVMRIADLPRDADGAPRLRPVFPVARVLHRATCETVLDLGPTRVKLCGRRAELIEPGDDDIQFCGACLAAG